jgi:hypothetical protein
LKNSWWTTCLVATTGSAGFSPDCQMEVVRQSLLVPELSVMFSLGYSLRLSHLTRWHGTRKTRKYECPTREILTSTTGHGGHIYIYIYI